MRMKITEINQALLQLKQHALPFVAEEKHMSLDDSGTIDALSQSAWFRDEWLDEMMSDKVSSLISFIKASRHTNELFELFQIPTPQSGLIRDRNLEPGPQMDAQLDRFFRDGRHLDALVKYDKEQISINLTTLNHKTSNLIQQIVHYISQFHVQSSFYENLVRTQTLTIRCQYEQSKTDALQQIELLSQLAKTHLQRIEQITKQRLPAHYNSFRDRAQKIQESLSSIAKTLEHQQSSVEQQAPSNSTASSNNHTQSPQKTMNLNVLMDFHETQSRLRQACGDKIEKLRQCIQESLYGIKQLDFTDINKLNLWLNNLTGCQSSQWNWDAINQQCQRLKLYRMLQTDPNGKLDTSDHRTDLQQQDYSETEEVFFKLLTTIIDSHGQESLILNRSDCLILKSLNQKYWQHEDLLGCHAIHILANCGEGGTNNVVLNHCGLLQKIITEQPRLSQLHVANSISGPHPRWNLLNFILFHFMRVTATPTFTDTPLETAYPGLISLIRTIKQKRQRHYTQLLGQEDFTNLLSDSPKPKDRNSLVKHFFEYGNCRLHLNGTTLDLIGPRSTPKSNSIALIPIKAFYEEIANELFCLDQCQYQNIRTLINGLQTKATNNIRSRRGDGSNNTLPFRQYTMMQQPNAGSGGGGSSSTNNTTESKGNQKRSAVLTRQPLLQKETTLFSQPHASSRKRNLPSIVHDIRQLIKDLKQFQQECQCQPNFDHNLFVHQRVSYTTTQSSGGGSPLLTIDPNHEPKTRFRQLEKRASEILQPPPANPHGTFDESAYGRRDSEQSTANNPESRENIQHKCSRLIQQLAKRLQNEESQQPPKKRLTGHFML